MLHVALDLTSLPNLKGGVAHYLSELVAALRRNPGGCKYSLLVRAEHGEAFSGTEGPMGVIPIRIQSRPLRLLWEQTGLPALLRRLGADVLHSPHYTRPLTRVPCASLVGIMDLTFFLMPQYHTRMKVLFFQRMMRMSARTADRFIAISDSTRRDLTACLGVDRDRIDVTPLAVSPAFQPVVDGGRLDAVRRKYGLPDRFILYVGRLEPRKNLLRLLVAYRELLEGSEAVPALVLAGAWGWQSNELRRRVDELAERVSVPGFVPDEDLPALYSAATLFVYPSLYEGFGIPVLEAMSCGAPTLTSAVSSMPEVAGDAAELVDTTDTRALTEALAGLIADPERRAVLRTRGLRRAALFSRDQTARLTADSYTRTYEQWRRRR
jgi:glycosyltransferase involved in cell wall biosynthesis